MVEKCVTRNATNNLDAALACKIKVRVAQLRTLMPHLPNSASHPRASAGTEEVL